MSIVLLLSSTSIIKRILKDNNPIDTIMKCAFLENITNDNSNTMLYEH